MIIFRLDFCFTAQNNTSLTCFKGVFYTSISVDSRTCREIRSFDILHQISYFHFPTSINVGHTAVQHLAKVVCWHICRHTNGDTRCSIYQQIRNTSRQYGRLFQCIIEIQLEINRIFVDIAKHFFGKFT